MFLQNFGGAGEFRTRYLLLAKQALSQIELQPQNYLLYNSPRHEVLNSKAGIILFILFITTIFEGGLQLHLLRSGSHPQKQRCFEGK